MMCEQEGNVPNPSSAGIGSCNQGEGERDWWHGSTEYLPFPTLVRPPSPSWFYARALQSATPLPLTSAHLELARPHFPSCRWDCELWLPGRYPLTLHAVRGRAGLPPVPTPPNLYHPALAQLEGATLSCWVLGALLGWAGCLLGWAGWLPSPARAGKPPSFFLCDLSSNFTPLSPPTPIHSRITTHRQRRFTRPSPSRHILQPRQDHSSAPPEPIWPLQPSYPQHHLVYSMTCTSTPMNCIAPHSQVDTL